MKLNKEEGGLGRLLSYICHKKPKIIISALPTSYMEQDNDPAQITTGGMCPTLLATAGHLVLIFLALELPAAVAGFLPAVTECKYAELIIDCSLR